MLGRHEVETAFAVEAGSVVEWGVVAAGEEAGAFEVHVDLAVVRSRRRWRGGVCRLRCVSRRFWRGRGW